jgi:hypothetical protein
MNTFECYKCGGVANQVITVCAGCASEIKEVQPASAQQLKPKMPSLEEVHRAFDGDISDDGFSTADEAEAITFTYNYIARHFGR